MTYTVSSGTLNSSIPYHTIPNPCVLSSVLSVVYLHSPASRRRRRRRNLFAVSNITTKYKYSDALWATTDVKAHQMQAAVPTSAHTNTRVRDDLYCVEWDVKLYYAIPYTNTKNVLRKTKKKELVVIVNDFIGNQYESGVY